MLLLSPAQTTGSIAQGTVLSKKQQPISFSPTPCARCLLQYQGHGLRASRAERAEGQLGHTLDQEALEPPVSNKVAMVAELYQLHVASPLASWP